MRSTHTYAVLRISRAAFEEIERLMRGAGYEDQFDTDGQHPGQILIDMHGVAVGPDQEGATP